MFVDAMTRPYHIAARADRPEKSGRRPLLATLQSLDNTALEWCLVFKCAWLAVVFLDFNNVLESSAFYACMFGLARPDTWAILSGSLAALSLASLSIPSSAGVVRLVARELSLLGQVGLFSALAWLAACGRPFFTSIVFGDLMILAVFAFLAAAKLGLSFGKVALVRHRPNL